MGSNPTPSATSNIQLVDFVGKFPKKRIRIGDSHENVQQASQQLGGYAQQCADSGSIYLSNTVSNKGRSFVGRLVSGGLQMPAHRQPAKPHKRLGYWYLVRRVPKEFRSFDRRNPVMISTGIPIVDDPHGLRARKEVARLDAVLEQEWRVLKTPPDVAAEARFEEYRSKADKMGIDYVPADELVDLPLDQIMKRLVLLANEKNASDRSVRSALLGVAPRPTLMVSQLLKEYNLSSKVAAEDQQGMVQAFKVFKSVIGGDRPLSNLTRRDIVAYRAYWERQLEQNERPSIGRTTTSITSRESSKRSENAVQ
ncbi:MAG: hypothetical protein IPL91_08380 [Hyphomicrobium sp.]|nr:hypothetical protein [Hyphomicrobium sp.]